MGYLKAQNESEIIVAQDQGLQIKYREIKSIAIRNRQQMQTVNGLMRQWKTSYRHAQYRKTNST